MRTVILLTVKASHDRDESCNDYTLERTFKFRLTHPPTDSDIRDSCRELIAEFTNTYPHRGRDSRTPSIDVSIREGVEA